MFSAHFFIGIAVGVGAAYAYHKFVKPVPSSAG